ncbi:MAG TPA: hypothetical protein VHX61_11060 [Rhizomicrobium sp.]|jgi:hypothetical protein|nr:hypothetical protein [Rhizomicrobium sp.]
MGARDFPAGKIDDAMSEPDQTIPEFMGNHKLISHVTPQRITRNVQHLHRT